MHRKFTFQKFFFFLLRSRSLKHSAAQGMVSLILMLAFTSTGNAMSVSYAYNLSDTAGDSGLTSPRLFADQDKGEIFALDEDSTVRVFNKSGMETYRFNDDKSLGVIADLVVDRDGNILLLRSAYEKGAWKKSIVRCDFRGEPQSTIPLNLPDDFHPNTMVSREGRLYLADKATMQVVVTTEEGAVKRSVNIARLLGFDKKHSSGMEMSGFSVDREGNILFTIPVQFRAYRLSPEGKVDAFGQPGSRPGGFNIAAGILTDDAGHYFVTDKLKCAVLVFDKDFNFEAQFGYRGYGPGGLVVPMDMAILDNRLYVSQGAQRGVSVFTIDR